MLNVDVLHFVSFESSVLQWEVGSKYYVLNRLQLLIKKREFPLEAYGPGGPP